MVSYENLLRSKNLFIGAHPDDVILGASMLISKNPKKSFVITITNGAPAEKPGYFDVRKKEEKKVFKTLGVPSKQLINLGYCDQKSHLHIKEIIETIKYQIIAFKPDNIFTHTFPEGHPDHEIACFTTHQAIKELGMEDTIRVFEWPTYVIPPGKDRINCSFVNKNPTVIYNFSKKESSLRNKLILLYRSQPDLAERYTTTKEQFIMIERDFSEELPLSDYIKPWVREISPVGIRAKIKEYV